MMFDCDSCVRIMDAWVASRGEPGMSPADREALHSPEFRDHVNHCDACGAYLGEASAKMAEAARLTRESERAAEDKVLLAHLLDLFEHRGLLGDDGQLAVVQETPASPPSGTEATVPAGDRRSFEVMADAIRKVGGQAATLVGAFGLRLPRLAPATRGDREGVAETPPHQLALSMPALEEGSWQPGVTLEVRPAEIRLLLTARPGAIRAELAAPHAAIHTKDGALVMASDSAELRWLEDGSDRCFLTVWQARSADEKLQDLIDPAADDSLLVWIT